MKLEIQGSMIAFTFEGEDALIFDAGHVEDVATQQRAMMLGYSNTLRDSAAIERKSVPGGIVTEAMRRTAVEERIAQLVAGEWSAKRAKAPTINPTWAAIAAKRGMTYEAYVAERAAADLAELQALEG